MLLTLLLQADVDQDDGRQLTLLMLPCRLTSIRTKQTLRFASCRRWSQSQIDSNDGDISTLQNAESGLANEITQRQFGDAANANAIGANTANLNTEIQNRIDGDQALEDYDAYLLDLISNTANTPLDVANILEGLDYFDDNGDYATVNLEAGWTLVDFGMLKFKRVRLHSTRWMRNTLTWTIWKFKT